MLDPAVNETKSVQLQVVAKEEDELIFMVDVTSEDGEKDIDFILEMLGVDGFDHVDELVPIEGVFCVPDGVST